MARRFVTSPTRWAYCGMLIGVGRRWLSLDAALVVHAVGAPIGFALLSLLSFKRFACTTPLQTAVVLLAVVVAMDVFLVAPVFEGSYAMFASPLGTWIPFRPHLCGNLPHRLSCCARIARSVDGRRRRSAVNRA